MEGEERPQVVCHDREQFDVSIDEDVHPRSSPVKRSIDTPHPTTEIHETTERLEVRPAAFTRHVTVRPTYVKKGDPEAKPTTAPLPPALLEGSVLTASLGAHLLTEKFCHHQPFWRQEWRMRAACGVELPRNLMCHWHNHLADLLRHGGQVFDRVAHDWLPTFSA